MKKPKDNLNQDSGLPSPRDEWASQFCFCFICGWSTFGHPPKFRWLETHEIARGPARKNALAEPAAWLRTCNICHEREVAAMPIARQLAYKLLHDPENYDRVKVNLLRRRQPDAVTAAEVVAEVETIRQSGGSCGWVPVDRDRSGELLPLPGSVLKRLRAAQTKKGSGKTEP